MKKFKFTLAGLLKLRISVEKQQKAALAQADARIAVFRAELTAMVEDFASHRAKYLGGGLTVAEFRRYGDYFSALRDRIEQQNKKIQVAQQERERIRAQVVETMRSRKALEKLRQNQYEAWRTEVSREEEKTLADFISFGVSGKMAGERDGRQSGDEIPGQGAG